MMLRLLPMTDEVAGMVLRHGERGRDMDPVHPLAQGDDPATYARLTRDAATILEGYIEEIARLTPRTEASDNLQAAYDWLVRFERAEGPL